MVIKRCRHTDRSLIVISVSALDAKESNEQLDWQGDVYHWVQDEDNVWVWNMVGPSRGRHV